MSESGEDPAFDDLHAELDLGLVAGFADPGGEDGSAVVGGHLGVGAVELWLVAVGEDDTGFEVVGHQRLGDAAQEGEGTLV